MYEPIGLSADSEYRVEGHISRAVCLIHLSSQLRGRQLDWMAGFDWIRIRF